MELLRGTAPKARFYHPTTDTEILDALVSVDGGIGVSTAVTGDDSSTYSEVQLPYLQSVNSSIKVVWVFEINEEPYTEAVDYEVVTPYLTKQELQDIWPEGSDKEIADVESAVRHIINAHTGQSFGYGYKTLTVEGHGEDALRLPERLVELVGLSTLTATLNNHRAIIVSDGWYLKKGWSDNVTTIASTDEYFLNADVNYSNAAPGEPGYEKPGHGPIIVAPGASGRPTKWRDDYPFKITGWWGYKTIPAAVKEAARLLVNDYACQEAIYRDRYLVAIKAADWRLQFASSAWDFTGNVRADQLLSEYVLAPWAVI